jgi:hypothetical protein
MNENDYKGRDVGLKHAKFYLGDRYCLNIPVKRLDQIEPRQLRPIPLYIAVQDKPARRKRNANR